MSRTLPSYALTIKNALTDAGAWLILIEIDLPYGGPLRYVADRDDVTWPSSGGDLFTAIDCDPETLAESLTGELAEVQIRISNVDRRILYYIDLYDGLPDEEVRLKLVHSDHLAETTPVRSWYFLIKSIEVDSHNAVFMLATDNPYKYLFPPARMSANHCRYVDDFKGSKCKYAGGETTCNGTLAQCQAYGNQENFGGFPGLRGAR